MKLFAQSLDIFSFLPIPHFTDKKTSSKRSQCASITLMILMIAYLAFTFNTFLNNNVPSTSAEEDAIGDKVFIMPEIVVTMVPNIDVGVSLVDQTVYSVHFKSGTLFQGLKKTGQSTTIASEYGCNPPMLAQQNFTNFICPSQNATLKGSQLSSSEYTYFRIILELCQNSTTSSIICKPYNEIISYIQSARVYIFMGQPTDFAGNDYEPFKSLAYYLNPTVRAISIIDMQPTTIISSPDLFHTFTTSTVEALFYERERNLIGMIPPGGSDILSIDFRLTDSSETENKVPQTLLQLISLWGAFWGVLGAVGGIYFLYYNQKMFYMENPKLRNFMTLIEDKQTRKPSDVSLKIVGDGKSPMNGLHEEHDEMYSNDVVVTMNGTKDYELHGQN
jgi:hypothetical protein